MSEAAGHAAVGGADGAQSRSLAVEIVSPAGRVIGGTCGSIVAPAIHGEVGILPGHAPYLAALATGVVRIDGFAATAPAPADSPSGEVRVFVAGGFLEVLENRVVVLAETAERGDRVDTVRAESSRKRASDRLAAVDQPATAVDRTRARRAVLRATSRLKAAGASSGAHAPHA